MLYYWGFGVFYRVSVYIMIDEKVFETFPIVSESGAVSQNAAIPVVRRNLKHWYKEIITIESYASSFTSFEVSFNFIFIKIR